MTNDIVIIKKYQADEGKVFDWKEPRFETNENGEEVQIHLYATTLFLGSTDDIENYIEIDSPKEV